MKLFAMAVHRVASLPGGPVLRWPLVRLFRAHLPAMLPTDRAILRDVEARIHFADSRTFLPQ